MRTVLTILLTANLILLGCLVLKVESARNAADRTVVISTAATTTTTNATAVTNTAAVAFVPPPKAAEPFHWKQLDASNDYRVYVANLRAAGCPERSVRAIVMADVNAVFFHQRAELHVDGTDSGPWSRFNEVQTIADLLGDKPVADSASVANAEKQPDPAENPVLPLVFRNVDFDALGLGDEAKASIERLRQQFLDEISPQNPSDPAYMERWRQAQPEIDAMLHDMIGVAAYQEYQAQINREPNS